MKKDRQDDLEIVYLAFAKPLYNLLKLTGSAMVAEELVQETFYNYLSNSTDFESPYGVPEAELAAQEVAKEVTAIMKMLPENYRSILYLRGYQQFTNEELSETLELSSDQVKVTLYRAKQRFKQLATRLRKNFESGVSDGVE